VPDERAARDHVAPPDPSLAERSRAVATRTAARAGADGFVPFDRFMEVALYADGVGFYARDASPFGPSGDFYTAAHVHPLFGQTLAERIRAVARALGAGRPFRIVEIGSGDGTLATTILGALGPPSPVPGAEYLLVERSASLRRASLERVEDAGRRAGIAVRLASSVGADGPFEGVVLANEVLDAQPVRRLRWTGTEWTELGVRVVGETLVAAEAPLVSPVPGPGLPTSVEAGTILEVSPTAEGLVREVADHLLRGSFVVLDYGMEESELLSAHPSGTLESVRRHRVVSDPLEAPGATDLSTFVNLTRIREVARRAGLAPVLDCSQAEALGEWGFPVLFDAAIRAAGSTEAEVRVRLAAKNLLFGFERFRALEWSAGAAKTGDRTAT
jgi:SAM-dependent MidA family methyltransferase